MSKILSVIIIIIMLFCLCAGCSNASLDSSAPTQDNFTTEPVGNKTEPTDNNPVDRENGAGMEDESDEDDLNDESDIDSQIVNYSYNVVRTSWSDYVGIGSNALNAEAIANGDNQCPVYRFDTLDDANDFKLKFASCLSFDAYNNQMAGYDESFFTNNSIVLVYIEAGSGSCRFAVEDVKCVDGKLSICVAQSNSFEVGTCDMAGWFALIEIADGVLNDCTSYEAGFDINKNTFGNIKKPF